MSVWLFETAWRFAAVTAVMAAAMWFAAEFAGLWQPHLVPTLARDRRRPSSGAPAGSGATDVYLQAERAQCAYAVGS
jgi:hypothetical protein